jgi:lipopolysaccharide heptosyltransferase II
MKQKSKKILVMRYRFIGDTILTIPFLRNLRRAEPDAYIAWMVAPGSSDVVKDTPYVDELIFWDPVTIHADSRGTHRTVSAKLQFIKELRKKKFDKVYVLKRSLSSALLAWFSAAPKRIGFDTEGRGLLLTTRVSYRHDRHEVENFLAILKADGVPVVDDHLELWTTPEEEAKVARVLAESGIGPSERIAAIHPFSAVVERGWPLENFAELTAGLAEKGYRAVILGGPGDTARFQDGSSLFPKQTVVLVGQLTIRETAALLKQASLFVGNDSGIMHVAAAAGVPLVALFGPQSPLKFGPWSKKARVIYKNFSCSPCRQKFFTECKPSERKRPACVEEITVAEVLQKCMSLLKT